MGSGQATEVATRVELKPHRDSTWDPFAALNGLTSKGP